jgi:predicted dithiol-disulfide oxidoreductase (DUF899 family)
MHLPEIVDRETWRAARLALLASEKDMTRRRDALAAERRRLPMVRVDAPYVFDGPRGAASLLELFDGRRQLVVYHFMFDPDEPPPGKSAPWSEGCHGCSFFADGLGHLAHLHARETTLVLVSRAPLAKIRPFQQRMGWTVPWYSSGRCEFNRDFHVTVDPERGSREWNYRDVGELEAAGELPSAPRGTRELPGLSVFLRDGDAVHHTYSTYARGLDPLIVTYQLLDLTPLGRGEGWGGMPDVDGKGMGWLRHHDRYGERAEAPHACCE